MNQDIFIDNIHYIKKAIYQTPLEREEEHQLAKRWHLYKDDKALQKLVESHFRLVISQVYRYRNYGLPFSDLCQEGMLGLIKAGMRFDPQSHDVRFSGYAKWWIKSFIQDYILRNWSIVRIGTTTSHKQLFFHLNRLKNQLLNLNYESLSPEDMKVIAENLNVSVRDVENIEKRLTGIDLSIHSSVNGEQDYCIENILPDLDLTPEEITQKNNDQSHYTHWLNKALESLTEMERKVIKMRYFKEDQGSFQSVGDMIGISKERARQLEKKAFRKMRHELVHNQKIKKEDIHCS